MTKTQLNALTYEVIGAAIEVHKTLGPGLLESIYRECMNHELNLRNIRFQSNLQLEIPYKGITVYQDLHVDAFIENALFVMFRAISEVDPIEEARLITYMKLLKAPKGLLLNFYSTSIFHNGQKTRVNEIFRQLPD